MRFRFAGIASLNVLIASAAAFGASPALKPFERGTWQGVLRGHAGRPVLVHFWGVTCGPCKVELPLLDKAGLSSTENFIFNDGFVERLRFEIDPAWQGDIPRTMLISRDGTITTIEGSAEIADLEKWSAQQFSKH